MTETQTADGRDAITATVDHQTNQYGGEIGHRLAEPSPALYAIISRVSEGDRLDVEYVRDGMDANAAGDVYSVERANNASADIRFGDGCYLHVNADTGNYHFQDSHPEKPEDGRRLNSITLDRE